jgi:ribonuclease G
MCEPCPACTGSGLVKTAQTTCYEVFRSIKRDARLRFLRSDAAERGEYTVRAHESVIDRLLDEHAAHLESLVAEIGRAVRLQVEPSCKAGEFDVVFVPVPQ